MEEQVEAPVEQVEAPQAPSWNGSLSDEYKSLPTFEKFKSADDLAKSYVNLEKMVGKDKIVMPKDEKDVDGWNTVYSRLGRPEAPDKYEVKLDLPEGLSVPDEAINSFKSVAHQYGLSNKQLQGIMGHWSELEKNAYIQSVERKAEVIQSTETGLRKELGANYDVAKTNVEAFINNFAPDEVKQDYLDGIKSNKDMFKTFYNASKKMGEDSLGGSKKQLGMSPEEAQQEYNAILYDVKGAYYNNAHPEHESTKQKMMKLLEYIQAGQ